MSDSPANIFISYSHRDARALDEFRDAIRLFDIDSTFTLWDDTSIRPGDNWRDEVERSLESAQVIVLLISANFLASDFLRDVELPKIVRRQKSGGATVVPIILSPTVVPPELAGLPLLPAAGDSIADQSDIRKAWLDAAQTVVGIITESGATGLGRLHAEETDPDPLLTTGDVVRALKQGGFQVQRRSESHYVLRDDADPPHVVVIPRKSNSIRGGLLRQTLRAAGMSESEFRSLLAG